MRKRFAAGLVAATVFALSAGANPTAYNIAPLLQQRDAFADRFWGAPAPASAAARGPAPVAAPAVPAAQTVPVQIVAAPSRPAQATAAAPAMAVSTAAASPMSPGLASPWYLSGALGMATLGQASNSGAAIANEHDYDAGVPWLVALGNQRTGKLAMEGELALRKFAVSTIKPAGAAARTATGTVSALSLMANATWSYDYGWPFNPYLLGGAGLARYQMDNVAATGVAAVNDSAWVIAYQLGFGAGVPIARRWELDASYRYFATLAPEFVDAKGRAFETTVASHNFLLGTKFRF